MHIPMIRFSIQFNIGWDIQMLKWLKWLGNEIVMNAGR